VNIVGESNNLYQYGALVQTLNSNHHTDIGAFPMNVLDTSPQSGKMSGLITVGCDESALSQSMKLGNDLQAEQSLRGCWERTVCLLP
jgi:hypothetical protein